MIDVTNQDFLPYNIILEFEQCQETIFDDTNDPYFDRTDQQPFESIAGKYACNSYGIDVFILPNDFLHTEQGGGGTVGGSTALTIPSKVLFLYGKTNCAYPSLFAYQNNIAQHFASVPHVLSHELGHCLGLIHTHDASNFTPAPNLYFCVNADCNWVATTVPAYCVAFQTNPVTIDPANQPNNGNPPFLENIMAYTNYFDCAPTFTTWQGELMRLYLSTHPLLSKIGHQVLGDLTITGTETWSPSDFFPFGNVVVNGSVDIQNGGTLNIMPGVKIRFREEDLILVRPGGSFSINHSFNLMNAYREQLDCSLSKILHKQLATNTIDSTAIWLTCLDKIDAYSPLVRMFTELDNLAASDSILQTIEQSYQLTELQANEVNSIQLLLDILEEVNLIEINTPTISLLQNFEITVIGFAKEWTRNILYEYGTYFSLNYELPSEIQARGGGNSRNYRHLKSQMSSVTVFPNPVDNKVIIFINNSLPTNSIFNVKNSYGLEVFHQILSPDQQILEIQTHHWQSGLYAWFLENDSSVKSNGKFIVVH